MMFTFYNEMFNKVSVRADTGVVYWIGTSLSPHSDVEFAVIKHSSAEKIDSPIVWNQ